MSPSRLLAVLAVNALSASSALAVGLIPLGTYETGLFDEGGAEIVAYDYHTGHAFVVNGGTTTIDALDINDPTNPTLSFSIDISPYGGGANSVAVHNGLIAAAVQADNKQDDGVIVFFDASTGAYINSVTAGALPDMVTFTPNGRYVLAANEGEPNDDYTVDPEGSVTIVRMRGNPSNINPSDVHQVDFNAFDNVALDPSVRVYGPGSTASQDFEPEYITATNSYAWVTLQENNAMALIDIRNAVALDVMGFGYKDHSAAGNAIDVSDRDGVVNIANWPILGMYQPDSIGLYRWHGWPLLITANEGDGREYDGYVEEARVKDMVLDPTAYPDAATLQLDENLGRLTSTIVNSDPDNDGDVDQIYSFGARSFSIWGPFGTLIYDSGDDLEQITAAAFPDDFNSTNDENGSFENRSDNKGPEPEGLDIGYIYGTPILFLGLERIGGVAMFDISNPAAPTFEDYVNTRDFSGDAAAGTAGDLGPEGVKFIPWYHSPTHTPLLVVTNEVSGSTTVFEVTN